MKGYIDSFNALDRTGVIVSVEGQRYDFSLDQWKEKWVLPQSGTQVEFMIVAGMAIEIEVIQNSTNAVQNNQQHSQSVSHYDNNQQMGGSQGNAVFDRLPESVARGANTVASEVRGGVQDVVNTFNNVGIVQRNGMKPESRYNSIDWFIKVLKNYANFKGRAGRKEYWFFVLYYFVLIIIARVLDLILGFAFGISIFYAITVLALMVPMFAVGARRLHDVNMSGWLQVAMFIPFVGLILWVFLMSKKPDPNANKYGNTVN